MQQPKHAACKHPPRHAKWLSVQIHPSLCSSACYHTHSSTYWLGIPHHSSAPCLQKQKQHFPFHQPHFSEAESLILTILQHLVSCGLESAEQNDWSDGWFSSVIGRGNSDLIWYSRHGKYSTLRITGPARKCLLSPHCTLWLLNVQKWEQSGTGLHHPKTPL